MEKGPDDRLVHAFILLDRTLVSGRFELIERQLNRLLDSLEGGRETLSRVQPILISMSPATCQAYEIERAQPERIRGLPSRHGCDLGQALQQVQALLETRAEDSGHLVEIFALLGSEPAGDWRQRMEALAASGNVSVTFFAFPIAGQLAVGAGTWRRISMWSEGARRLEQFTNKTTFEVFDEMLSLLKSAAEALDKSREADAPPHTEQAVQQTTAITPVGKESRRPADPTGHLAHHGPPDREAPSRGAEQMVSETDQSEKGRAERASVTAGPEPDEAESGQSTESMPLPAREEARAPAAAKARAEATAEPSPELTREDSDIEEDDEEAEPPAKPKPPPMDEGGVATIWKELEPEAELGDRVPHTDTDVLEASDGWRLIGASRRGKMHAHKGIFREDAFALGEAEGWHLMVVADGGGSCPLSRVGSQLAADAAVETMKQLVRSMTNSPLSPEKTCEIALQQGLQDAWKALKTEADRREVALRDLGTTFLGVMHRPTEGGSVAGVIQVGDGLVMTQFADGKVGLLAEPDVGDTAGATFFLTSKPWKEWLDRVNVVSLESTPELLTAMCDGVADDFIPFEKYIRKLVDSLGRLVQEEEPEQALLQLLSYEKRGSFDDRTLTLIYRTDDESESERRIKAGTGEQGRDSKDEAVRSGAASPAADETERRRPQRRASGLRDSPPPTGPGGEGEHRPTAGASSAKRAETGRPPRRRQSKRDEGPGDQSAQ